MKLDPWTSEAVRRTRRTLYRLAGFYVLLGFAVAILASVAGDLVSAFLGFLIVGGTIAAAVGLDSMLRLTGTTLAMLAEIRDRLSTLESTGTGTVFELTEEDGDSMTIDVAAGTGYAPSMVAGTLDMGKFPRLVAGVVDFEAPRVHDVGTSGDVADSEGTVPWDQPMQDGDEFADAPGWVSPTRNAEPMRRWRVALHRGDLEACRAAYDRLVAHVSAVAAETMEATLRDLEHRTEQELRRTFAAQVRSGSYDEAVETGDRISRLFPAGRAAADFKRLRDVLVDRLESRDAAYAQ